MYNAYITRIKNVRKHPNADRLQLGECFGNTVVVSLDYEDNQIGIYFPSDGQLSVEFAEANNLLRKKDDAGNNIGGYMDADKRNVTAIRLRGEKSDGLFLPLTSLESFGDVSKLAEGDRIDTFNGHEICCKYIPRTQHRRGHYSEGNKTRKKKSKAPVSPLFSEHVDTEQLAYNLGAFKPGDEIEITLKMHGTSQRTGYFPVLKGYKDSWHCRLKNGIKFWIEKIRHKIPLNVFLLNLDHDGEPIYDWGYVSGTRRVVLENFDGGYYGSNEFREAHSKFFEGKLNKGEEVFYEVVGFTHTGAPIMASGDNKKLNDKEFVKKYGQTTVFSYGCDPEGTNNGHYEDTVWVGPQSDIYVYRMTMTNEDGFTVEYTPDFMRYRCEQMGVKTVPVMWKGTIPEGQTKVFDMGTMEEYEQTPGDWIKDKAEEFYDGPDPIGKTHIREGVVVRIINRPKFAAYKHKNFSFKCLEGLVKATAETPDMEEAQDVSEIAQNV
jgi:hypothetical protein